MKRRGSGEGLRAGVEERNNFKAAAHALVQAGLNMASACRGGCGSRIVSEISSLSQGAGEKVCAELSINEKCAFEAAYGSASVGVKAACLVGQDGLNAVFASLVKALEKPIEGGLVIMVIDDRAGEDHPGEQGTALTASLYGIPIYGPVSLKHMSETVFTALTNSVKQRRPVIIECGQEFSGTRPRRSSAPPLSETMNALPQALFLEEGPACSPQAGSEDGCSIPLMSEPVAFGAGFFDVLRDDESPPQIVISVEDQTFFRSCLASLLDAVRKDKKFTLVVADGGGYPLAVEGAARALGVSFIRAVDTDDVGLMIKTVREAFEYLKQDGAKPAVIVRKLDPVSL